MNLTGIKHFLTFLMIIVDIKNVLYGAENTTLGITYKKKVKPKVLNCVTPTLLIHTADISQSFFHYIKSFLTIGEGRAFYYHTLSVLYYRFLNLYLIIHFTYTEEAIEEDRIKLCTFLLLR